MTAVEGTNGQAAHRRRGVLTPEHAKAGGKAIAAKRYAEIANREHRIALADRIVSDTAIQDGALALIDKLLEHFGNSDLPPITSALDAERFANAMSTLHKMRRLEQGESTQNVAHRTVDTTELQARLNRLSGSPDTLDA